MEAIAVARRIKCDICDAKKGPKVARHHRTSSELPRPLQRLGMDVKYLRSWKGIDAPKIPVLNMLDLGSKYQTAEPLDGQETGQTLKKAESGERIARGSFFSQGFA